MAVETVYLENNGNYRRIPDYDIVVEQIKQVLDICGENLNVVKRCIENDILYIENVRRFDVKNKEFEHGRLEIKENTIDFISPKAKITVSFNENYEIYLNKQYMDNGDIFVSWSSETSYILINNEKEKNYKLLENYYKNYNDKITKRKLSFKESVELKVNELINNDEIRQLIINFIDQSKKDIFLDVTNYITFEQLIIINHLLATEMVYSTIEQRNRIYDENQNNDNLYVEVNNYKTTSFDYLVKILSRKVEFESDEICIFTTWRLLNLLVIDFFYDYWENEYGLYFIDINDKSLEECCNIYCDADMIEENNIFNVSLFTYFLIKHNKFNEYVKKLNYIECYSIILPLILNSIENKKIREFESKLSKAKGKISYSIDDVDLMTGYEFESLVAKLFSKMGYNTTVTKASGDQGIDVIAEKNGKKIGIQAKCYSSKVSNSAIQEVVAGVNYYNCDKGVVVSNNYYTNSAIELAQSNNIILWDREMLSRKIDELLNR